VLPARQALSRVRSGTALFEAQLEERVRFCQDLDRELVKQLKIFRGERRTKRVPRIDDVQELPMVVALRERGVIADC
jgi:hypothetical protein